MENRKEMISFGTVCQNRKARFNYTVVETLEAGIVLEGSEVKSLRMGAANIGEAYAIEKDGELFLNNALITALGSSGHFKHIEGRARKLLLHKKEMSKLLGLMARKGYTIVPLEIYFNNRGLAKVKLGLAVGKNVADKRETEKKREWNKEKQRILNYKNR